MNNYITLLLIGVMVMVTGCQSAPPVPADKYFRLEVTETPVNTPPILNETVYVAPLRAEGPYAERAMLFATAEQFRVLQQYHYQHWSEPPALLLQEHLRGSLEKLAIAPHVTDMLVAGSAGYLLSGKILRLEKIIDANQSKAIVSLHLVMQKKKPLSVVFERSYTEEVLLLETNQNAYVIATESALNTIYQKFCQDIGALK